METEPRYWVRQPHHVQARAPNVQTLRYWGSCLKGPWRRRFENLHDNLLSLLEVETQPAALEALAQYYDSPIRCFTFKDFQMAPTLEEYERLMGLPLTESPLYFHQGQPPSWATIARLLRVSEIEMAKRRRNRNGTEGIPRNDSPGKPLILYLTVLDESMGCMLGQQDEAGKERAVYYLSKKFTDCEKRYPTLERTYCTLVWATKRLRPYMLSHVVWLVAKIDPIKYILEKPALTGRIARWQMALSEYDITYVSRHAVKGGALADHLTYHPLVESQPLAHKFPDEYIMQADEKPRPKNEWAMWFDGASNILGNGIGVVLASPTDQYFPFAANLGFACTNNMAEYEACTMGLTMALEYQVKRLRVYGDSALVIYQLRGEWETRDSKLIPYYDYVKEMTEVFDAITFHHVPREENQMADALATLSAMVRVNEGREMTIHVRQLPRMAYCHHLSLEAPKTDQEPWYLDIKKYLEKGEYPEGALENNKRI
ncbi:rnhA, partial [Mucuna pruriens]